MRKTIAKMKSTPKADWYRNRVFAMLSGAMENVKEFLSAHPDAPDYAVAHLLDWDARLQEAAEQGDTWQAAYWGLRIGREAAMIFSWTAKRPTGVT